MRSPVRKQCDVMVCLVTSRCIIALMNVAQYLLPCVAVRFLKWTNAIPAGVIWRHLQDLHSHIVKGDQTGPTVHIRPNRPTVHIDTRKSTSHQLFISCYIMLSSHSIQFSYCQMYGAMWLVLDWCVILKWNKQWLLLLLPQTQSLL